MAKSQAELIQKMNDKEVLFHLYITQLLIIFIACILAFFLFEDLDSFFEIWEWNSKEILLFGGGSAIIVIVIDSILMKILPKEWYDDGGINEKVFKKRPVWHILIIALLVAVSEELLFRGIIQTHFGYLLSSILFALLHVRYLLKWALLLVVLALSFYIGWIYMITGNILVTIFMHFIIDFVFALIIRVKYLREVSN